MVTSAVNGAGQAQADFETIMKSIMNGNAAPIAAQSTPVNNSNQSIEQLLKLLSERLKAPEAAAKQEGPEMALVKAFEPHAQTLQGLFETICNKLMVDTVGAVKQQSDAAIGANEGFLTQQNIVGKLAGMLTGVAQTLQANAPVVNNLFARLMQLLKVMIANPMSMLPMQVALAMDPKSVPLTGELPKTMPA